jgi:hypothetical protein
MAAHTAVDEEEVMAIVVDDDEVPTQGERKRNTHTKELYDQFTDEDGLLTKWLANITCNNLDDHDIVFPELYEIYA